MDRQIEINKYIEFIKRWEGGLASGKSDSASKYPCPTPYNGKTGWHTNCGVTYGAWVHLFGITHDDRFYAMNAEDWFKVFKGSFWDKIHGDDFKSFSIAAVVSEVAWMSGVERAGKILQKSINNCGLTVVVDGSIGNKTISNANVIEPAKLFDAIQTERERFFKAIGVGKNEKYLKGWLNRLNDGTKTFRPH